MRQSKGKNSSHFASWLIVVPMVPLNIEKPLALVNLKLDEAKLIKLLIDSPEDNFVELKACFNSIPKASRNKFISDNELAYHCVNKCEKIDKFQILLEFIDAHEFKKVLNLNFIAYAFLYNMPIAGLACDKVIKLSEQVEHVKEDADLKEFCDLADLTYSKDLTSNQLKTAYYKFCKENHPDKNSNDPDAASEKFKKMQTCRDKLRHAF